MTVNTPAESCMGETINTGTVFVAKHEPKGSSCNPNHDFK